MSNFKMKHQGVPALMKTLTSGQQGMIKSMKESGKTAQATAIEKGIESAAPKKIKKPTDKSRANVGRGGADAIISESDKIVNRRDNRNSGKRDFEQVTQVVEKGQGARSMAKVEKNLRANTKQGDQAVADEMTMSRRRGKGRVGTKTYQRAKGQKGAYTMMGSTIAGTKTKGGRTQMRKLADGSEVVMEGSVNRIKTKGIQSPKVKKTDISKDLKEKAPRKKAKRVNEITKTAATMKKHAKGLKKAVLKKYGKKK